MDGRSRSLHLREKMICSILLLLSLTSWISGSFVVDVTQTSYQAEENQDVTLEWTFSTRTNSSSKNLNVLCQLLFYPRPSVLFHLHEGVEVPESQDKQFRGRVRCDKDVLHQGRVRLHISRLRTNDSGLYVCDVFTGRVGSSKTCHLNVTAAADEPEPQRPTESPQLEIRKRILIYVGLAVFVLVLCVVFYFTVCHSSTKSNRGKIYTDVKKRPSSEQQVISTNQAAASSAERLDLEGNPQTAKNTEETLCSNDLS